MSSPASLHQIVYTSSTKGLLTVDQLCELLVKSSAANQRQGISGVLLYKDGQVMQVIEGEQATISALFAKIKRDPRHTGVTTLLEGKLEKRNFPTWSMAFRNLKSVDLKLMPEYGEFASVPLSKITSPAQSVKLLSLFKNAA
jgi:hypothetical protein